MSGEALVNKDESQTAIRYGAQLFFVPLVVGFVVSRIVADPVLNFTLENNPGGAWEELGGTAAGRVGRRGMGGSLGSWEQARGRGGMGSRARRPGWGERGPAVH